MEINDSLNLYDKWSWQWEDHYTLYKYRISKFILTKIMINKLKMNNNEYENQYCDIRNLAISITSCSNKVVYDMKASDIDKIFVSILFEKIIQDLNSMVLLLNSDFINQACVIFRTILDKQFVMFAIINDKSHIDDFCLNQSYEVKRGIKNGYSLQLIDEIEKTYRLAQVGSDKNVPTSQWAKWAGMEDVYKREYYLFSDYVHVSDKTIRDCLIMNNGIIEGIDMKPEFSQKNRMLLTACNYAFVSLKKICEMFRIFDNSLDDIFNTKRKLDVRVFGEMI